MSDVVCVELCRSNSLFAGMTLGGAETAVDIEDTVACIRVFCEKRGGVGHFVHGTEAA